MNKKTCKNIVLFPFVLLIFQLVLTYFFTNAKRFSIQAYIMNLSWIYGVYFIYITKKIKYILIPLIMRFLFFVFNLMYGNIPNYITTDYLYSDFFENIIKSNKCNEHFTEGDYNNLLPFDTTSNNPDLESKIQKWGLEMYNNSIKDYKNKNIFNGDLMGQSQLNKYKWIVDNLSITQNSKVLELGFGKLDLMNYIRTNTGATVEGLNLSLKQIQKATKQGFKCYHISLDDLNNHMDVLDRYDCIITNGSLEYLINSESNKKFKTFSDSVYKLLLPGGKWYTTTLHMSDTFKLHMSDEFKNNKNINDFRWYDMLEYFLKNENTLSNIYNVYYLSSGNEGAYPLGKEGLTGWVSKDKFNVVLQQDRTIDYLLFSYNWLICQIKKKGSATFPEKIKSFIKHFICFLVAPLYHNSYVCYTPSYWKYQPWLWQFLRQNNGYRPVDHYWIIFQKK